ncbi:hypothetical protein ACOSQ2_003259 [Xanthoceras sorbifolium]
MEGESSPVGHSLDRDRNQPHCTNCIIDRDRGTNRLHLFPAIQLWSTKAYCRHLPSLSSIRMPGRGRKLRKSISLTEITVPVPSPKDLIQDWTASS